MKIIKILIRNKTGRSRDTKLLDAETGDPIRGATKITIEPIISGKPIRAKIEFINPQLDIRAESESAEE